MAMAKVAISLDDELYEDATNLADRTTEGNFSALVSNALREKLQRQALDELADQLDAEVGPMTEDDYQRTRKLLWPGT